MELPGTKTHRANTFYWQIYNGKFSRRVKEGEGTPRTTKTGKVVYENFVDSITGTLKEVRCTDSDYGMQLSIVLIPAPGYMYIINIQKDSRFGTAFLERLPSLNVGDVIEIKPYSFEDEKEKKVSGLNIFKGTYKVPSAFKEKTEKGWVAKNGFPPFPKDWSSLSEKKQKIYFIDVDEFLTEEFNKWVDGQNTLSETPANESGDNFISDDDPFA